MALGSRKRFRERFVICVETGSYKVSLQLLKVYRTLPDAEAERDKWIRVVDEEREDYLYPEDYFVHVELSPSARKRFIEAWERNDVAAKR